MASLARLPCTSTRSDLSLAGMSARLASPFGRTPQRSPLPQADGRIGVLRLRLAAVPPWERSAGTPPWERQPSISLPPLVPSDAAPPQQQQQQAEQQRVFQQQRQNRASPPPQPAAPAPPPGAFLTEQEKSAFSASQLEFLERKRRAAAGLGPVMPDSCTCPACSGSGSVECPQCGGSGVNAGDKAAELFQNERNLVIQNNGVHDMQWFFRQDCPCWLCRGKAMIGCAECSGSGMKGLADYVGD